VYGIFGAGARDLNGPTSPDNCVVSCASEWVAAVCFLDHRSILLRHLIHLVDRGIDLVKSCHPLFGARRSRRPI
jgi:hypothetical protein